VALRRAAYIFIRYLRFRASLAFPFYQRSVLNGHRTSNPHQDCFDFGGGDGVYRAGAQTVPNEATRQAAGKLAQSLCGSCHGAQGRGDNPQIPRLSAQHREYLYLQLKMIQNKLRESPVMHGLTKQLSSEELAAVTAYLESKSGGAVQCHEQ
jgi:cytochrome c553